MRSPSNTGEDSDREGSSRFQRILPVLASSAKTAPGLALPAREQRHEDPPVAVRGRGRGQDAELALPHGLAGALVDRVQRAVVLEQEQLALGHHRRELQQDRDRCRSRRARTAGAAAWRRAGTGGGPWSSRSPPRRSCAAGRPSWTPPAARRGPRRLRGRPSARPRTRRPRCSTSSGGRVSANTAPPATSTSSTAAAAPRIHFFLAVIGEAG